MLKFLERIIHKKKKKRNYACLEKADSAIILEGMRIDTAVNRKDICVHIGAESMVGCNFIFESDSGNIEVGERTYIGGGTNIISRSLVIIGSDVTIAWGVWIYDHNSHSLDWRQRRKDIQRQNDDYRNGRNFIASKDWDTVKTRPIKICDKAWIGFNAIILKGVTIGEGAVVGAGAVVTHDVPPYTIVAGNPAVVKGTVER